jgi:hypothetical protein
MVERRLSSDRNKTSFLESVLKQLTLLDLRYASVYS